MAIQARQSLLAKVEAAYGTDPTPAGVDAVRCIGSLDYTFNSEDAEIESVDAFLDGYAHVEGSVFVTVSFETPLWGSGAAGTAPEIGPLFKACGMDEVIVGATSVTYQPTSAFGAGAAGYQSNTFYIQDSTLQFQVHGVYGTFSIDASVSSFPKVSWSFTGLYERPTDVAAITAPTYDATRPAPCRGLTFQYAGITPRCTNWTLDLQREVHRVGDFGSTFGVAGFELGRCSPAGTFRVQERAIATENFWTVDTPVASHWSLTFGSTAGNICTITRPGGTGGIKFQNLSRGEDNGIITLDMAYSIGRNAGNDALELVFT